MIDREWLEVRRELFSEAKDESLDNLFADEADPDPLGLLITNYLRAILDELMYMNDSRDKMDEPKRLQPASFIRTRED